ncbi:RHS repeat domain-containing protein [Sphingobium aquiterrae]|uniref:RHS repeat domain-containing protein n=1 Tax=Sphingobium TaxID=165695 RepID=UPI003018DD10
MIKRAAKHRVLSYLLFAAAGMVLISSSPPALAQEDTTFQYDQLGRLIEVKVTGGPANGNQTKLAYDSTGNRQRYSVTGGRNRPPIKPVLVLPLNGYTVIPVTPR